MKWTTEQEQAILARGGNLLVSAAAGSGKTAVLVERILNRITDEKEPIDIDSIVVVTFTKAAASEMKDRLMERIQELLKEQPGNMHLMRQLALADHAKISTIDSFCSYILHNYYHELDLDPAFRVADESETELMRREVFDALLEERFSKATPEFTDFINAFGEGKKFDNLYQLIDKLYGFSCSMAWPDEWLASCGSIYEIETTEELYRSPLYLAFIEFMHSGMKATIREIDRACALVDAGPELEPYRAALESDRTYFQTFLSCKTLEKMHEVCEASFFAKLGTIKGEPPGKAVIKDLRDRYKKRIRTWDEEYFAEAGEETIRQLKQCRMHVHSLIRLTRDYAQAFLAAKKAAGVMDFSDIEHFALNILIRSHNKEELVYSHVADELAHLFEEIYIDEYQDSNDVQEMILNAVSRQRFGTPNIFMVGDVKQSIYRFRQAKPELFNEKYHSYRTGEGELYRKIELRENFRSRKNVLDCVNDIFFRAMHAEVGDIEYTPQVQLNYGREPAKDCDPPFEVICLDKNEDLNRDAESEAVLNNAHATALRIKELIRESKDLPEDKRIRPKDIVVLLRGITSNGPIFTDILREHGIETISEASAGFFETPEIRDMTNLLRTIDNPRQDIPLVGTMRSYFGRFTADELAAIKGPKRNTQFYSCLTRYAEENNELGRKCKAFLAQLGAYRMLNRTGSIRELLIELIYTGGYYDYVGLLPSGKLRKANLRKLIERADAFAETSYTGLFRFLQYIEKIKSYKLDMPEATIGTEYEDAVRIMTIHKSKGLQFPVVILAKAETLYNQKDLEKKILMDPKMGICIDAIDTGKRTQRKPLVKKMMKWYLMRESIGEELRILYVALTRAIDRVIVIGEVSANAPDQYALMAEADFDPLYIMENRKYLSLIAPVALSCRNTGRFTTRRLSPEDMREFITESIYEKTFRFKSYLDNVTAEDFAEEELADVRERMTYHYPHEDAAGLRSKYSVSDLKHAAMEEDETLEAKVVPPQKVKPIPYFLDRDAEHSETAQNAGTIYGNAYHKFFELLDYAVCSDETSLMTFKDEMLKQKKLSPEYAKKLFLPNFVRFLESGLGKRMKEAALRGELFREQPFIMEVAGNRIRPDAPAEESVLVQGIIDAFFFEGDKVIVVDYKTDHVPKGQEGEEILIKRYREQLALYVQALHKITGKKAGEAYLYSTCLNRELPVVLSDEE